MKNHTLIESLEARIAPATLVNPTTVTYTDSDGDFVTVKSSAGAFDLAQFTFAPLGAGEYLVRLDLSGLPAFQGANIAITAEKTLGDGLTTINQIKADGVDLGKVRIDGDLLRISAGDGSLATPGLKALTVQTLGMRSSYFPVGSESPTESFITGNLGSLKVIGDVLGGTVKVQGSIGKVAIGGSLVGKPTGGEIVASNSIGPVFVGGDIVGGGGNFFVPGTVDMLSFFGGRIVATTGGIESVKVGGSIVGSIVGGTGGIFAAKNVPSIQVGGSLIGTNNSSHSGVIEVGGNVGKINIGFNISGGGATIPNVFATGGIDVGGKLNTLHVGGDIIGGDTDGPGQVTRAGFVAAGSIGKAWIEGSLFGGSSDTDPIGGSFQTGSFLVGKTIDSLYIGGSFGGGQSLAGIYAGLFAGDGNGTKNVVIKQLTIRGDVSNAIIGAGFLPDFILSQNSEVQIGKVIVGGDWSNSNITAGAARGIDGSYGTFDDFLFNDANLGTGVVSSIAKIVIRGQVSGTLLDLDDGFGFVAERIGSFKANGVKAALKSGPDSNPDRLLVPGTSDVTIAELPINIT